MGPNGSDTFNTIPLLRIPAQSFISFEKFYNFLNFPPGGSHKTTFGGIFEICSYVTEFFLTIFVSRMKICHCAVFYGENKKVKNLKNERS